MKKALNFALLAATLFLKPALFASETVDLQDAHDQKIAVSSKKQSYLESLPYVGFQQVSSYLKLSEISKTIASKQMNHLFATTQEAWHSLHVFMRQTPLSFKTPDLIKGTHAKIHNDLKVTKNSKFQEEMIGILTHLSITQNPTASDGKRLIFAQALESKNPHYKSFFKNNQIYLSIARNPTALEKHRIEAALKAFEVNQEVGEEIASILISIAKNNTDYNTIHAGNALKKMGGYWREKAVLAYLFTAHNSNSPNQNRIEAALKAFELDAKTKQEVIDIFTSMEQNTNPSSYENKCVKNALAKVR